MPDKEATEHLFCHVLGLGCVAKQRFSHLNYRSYDSQNCVTADRSFWESAHPPLKCFFLWERRRQSCAMQQL